MSPPEPQPDARTQSRARRLLAALPWLVAFGFGTGLDQLTKAWAEQHVRPHGIITVIPGMLDLRYARNPGAFFSLGAELPDPLRQLLLCVASVLVIVLVVAMHRRTPPSRSAARFGLALLAGGGAGNLIDRARAGEVVDFVHLHAGAVLHWATFNLADVAITCGLCLLAIDLVRGQPDKPAPSRAAPALDGAPR